MTDAILLAMVPKRKGRPRKYETVCTEARTAQLYLHQVMKLIEPLVGMKINYCVDTFLNKSVSK